MRYNLDNSGLHHGDVQERLHERLWSYPPYMVSSGMLETPRQRDAGREKTSFSTFFVNNIFVRLCAINGDHYG